MFLNIFFSKHHLPTQENFVRWDAQQLAEACKPDHGFNADSAAIRMLYEILVINFI